jgi:hypothetical protein
MATPVLPFLAGLLVVTTASCGQPKASPLPVAAATAVEPAPAATAPSCSVESKQEIKLDDGAEMQIWNLKASGLKRLTARLLIASNEKGQTAKEVQYTWDAWQRDAPAATGQLVLMIQNGKAFGAKDKILPMMALDIAGSPSNSKHSKNMGILLEGDLQSRMVSSSYSSPLHEKNLIYSQVFAPRAGGQGSFSLSSDLDSAIAAAKDGRTVLAVTLDWAPQ